MEKGDKYSNREIDTMFESIHDKLDMILAQTTKTNGRVNIIESWKDKMTGAMITISFITTSSIIGLIIKLVWF